MTARREPTPTKCVICGHSFLTSRGKKTCSDACRKVHVAQRDGYAPLDTRTCPDCTKSFKPGGAPQIRCVKCQKAHRRNRKTLAAQRARLRHCTVCESEIPAGSRLRVFCSEACKLQRVRRTPDGRKCEVCEAPFEPKTWHQKWCNASCRKLGQRAANRVADGLECKTCRLCGIAIGGPLSDSLRFNYCEACAHVKTAVLQRRRRHRDAAIQALAAQLVDAAQRAR